MAFSPSARGAHTRSPPPARSRPTPISPRPTSCGRASPSPARSASIPTRTSPCSRRADMASPCTQQALARLADLTPRQIVAELDRYIVGQADAKKAVAIALRNRWRRQRAPESIRNEISPNNIILIGPTGVGKTEIARRLAKLAGAPFIKVEASKFTEVGYVGRDVEGMIRDLMDSAVEMVRQERESEVEDLANERVDERLLDLLLPPPGTTDGQEAGKTGSQDGKASPAPDVPASPSSGLFVVSASGDVK